MIEMFALSPEGLSHPSISSCSHISMISSGSLAVEWHIIVTVLGNFKLIGELSMLQALAGVIFCCHLLYIQWVAPANFSQHLECM